MKSFLENEMQKLGANQKVKSGIFCVLESGIYGGPQGTAANKCILVQTNTCGCKQIYIDAKIIKHHVKLINVAAN